MKNTKATTPKNAWNPEQERKSYSNLILRRAKESISSGSSAKDELVITLNAKAQQGRK